MKSWVSATLLAVAGVPVLVLGAAANGFESSLDRVPASTTTKQTSTESVLQSSGPPLRVSVVKVLVDRADNSSAVILRVANPDPRRAIIDAPIAIELLDRAGNVVGTNADAGTDPLLVHVPYVGPGGSALFVSDTIAASAEPSEAYVTGTAIFSTVRRPQLAVHALRLRTSPVGPVAAATLVSSANAGPRDVLVQAVVLRDGQVVAAGTTVVAVPRRGQPMTVEIFLVGAAKGGELRVWAPPQ